MEKFLSFISIYQYFDSQEIVLKEKIESIQDRVLYNPERSFSSDDLQNLLFLKIKLDFCRKIEADLLKLLNVL